MYDIEKYDQAVDVADAIRALENDPDAVVISGGSDVLIKIREGKLAGCSLVSIHGIKELEGISLEPDGTIVICEVKTRSQGMLQRPAAAVDPAKQHRLICAAQGYLQQTGQSEEPVRFDVAEVVPLDSGRWMVHIIKGAFLCET